MKKLKEVLTIIDTRLQSLEHTVNDVIIKSLLDADDEFTDNERFETFSSTYDFSGIEPGMKVLYGDDFDCRREFYNRLKEMSGYGTDEFDEAGEVNSRIADLKERLAKLGYKAEVSIEAEDTDENNLEEQLAAEFAKYSSGL